MSVLVRSNKEEDSIRNVKCRVARTENNFHLSNRRRELFYLVAYARVDLSQEPRKRFRSVGKKNQKKTKFSTQTDSAEFSTKREELRARPVTLHTGIRQ